MSRSFESAEIKPLPGTGLELSLIAAVARNRVIGLDGRLPWKLSSDLKRFKRLTSGSPVIMGRRTYESIGRALPRRLNLVLTRRGCWQAPDGVETLGSLAEALERAAAAGAERCFVIGGASVYSAALPLATRLDITWVECDAPGDTFFPEIDLDQWLEVESERVETGPKDECATRYVRYARKVI